MFVPNTFIEAFYCKVSLHAKIPVHNSYNTSEWKSIPCCPLTTKSADAFVCFGLFSLINGDWSAHISPLIQTRWLFCFFTGESNITDRGYFRQKQWLNMFNDEFVSYKAPIHCRGSIGEQVMQCYQICSHEETNSSASWAAWGQIFIFGLTHSQSTVTEFTCCLLVWFEVNSEYFLFCGAQIQDRNLAYSSLTCQEIAETFITDNS